MGFGALRVLNDDIVTPGMGFGTHSHDNMEIVSIPLSGDLEHKDSTGNTEVIRTGDVQIMSAGSGLTHSEYNHSKENPVNFLQIWILPKVKNITPRYQQITFDESGRSNKIQTVVAPDDEKALWINQDAWFSLADLDGGRSLEYIKHDKYSGIYVFVLEGAIDISGEALGKRDAIRISESENININAAVDSKLLILEVPM
jgi:redox-sensitive bicupin YhaK (pirin superfamily)